MKHNIYIFLVNQEDQQFFSVNLHQIHSHKTHTYMYVHWHMYKDRNLCTIGTYNVSLFLFLIL